MRSSGFLLFTSVVKKFIMRALNKLHDSLQEVSVMKTIYTAVPVILIRPIKKAAVYDFQTLISFSVQSSE